MNRKRAISTSRVRTMSLPSADWHRRTDCMSSYARAHTSALNGRWVAYPGGC